MSGTHLVIVFVDVLVQLVQRHQVVELSGVALKHKGGISHHGDLRRLTKSVCVLTLDNSARAEFISWSLADTVCLISA